MRKAIFLLILFALYGNYKAQEQITIKLIDVETSIGIPYAHVMNKVSNQITTTNQNGQIRITGNLHDSIGISVIGYGNTTVPFEELAKVKQYPLSPQISTLEEFGVVDNKRTDLGVQRIDKLTLKLLPLNNAQDLLKTVSGLFIAQHAGGGKAEQVFLRGFDNDHGTDFGVFIDDIPINLTSHAHGQGYADLHFIIPEIIADADYYKGPYEPKNGNFSVSGAARYKTKNALDKNMIKLELGDFNFQRALATISLTPNNHLFSKKRYEQAYIAIEGVLNEGFFESSQDFKKVSTFFKYNTQLNDKTSLTLSSSYFTSNWNASGQIPLRAVKDGVINSFGAIDDSEGGSTSRLNNSLKINTFLKNNQQITNHFYHFYNEYQLLSNFTFFLNNPVAGDLIEQLEARNVFGYTFNYQRRNNIGKTNLRSTFSLGVRSDNLNTQLKSSIKRNPTGTLDNNKIQETNYWAYIKENWMLSENWVVQAGSRIDVFNFNVKDQLENSRSGNRVAHRISPKLSVFYNPTKNWQLFAKGGAGYHSNYTQAAVGDPETHPLPKALAADLGSEFKLGKKWVATFALWTIQSDAEYIFVADAGEFENNGASLRRGIDFSTKYNLFEKMWISLSANLNKGILLDEPDNANSIPSAPRFTSTASFIYKYKALDFYFGTRYMARRPLTEDEAVFADDYFLVDATVNYTLKKIQLGISVQNIFNQRWIEAVFYDASQLQTEPEPVEDFHFTPGTPRFIKTSISYIF